MSYKSISTFFLIVVVLYAAANPVAHGTITPRTLNVTGRLCCTANGNCIAGSVGVAGATVNLNCRSSLLTAPTVVATATTDAGGNFVLTAQVRPIVISRCTVTVALPLTGAAAVSCSLLAAGTPGTLTSRIRIISITGPILARIYSAVPVTFARA